MNGFEFEKLKKPYSVLQKLKEERIVEFFFDEEGNLCIGECCDEYYAVTLDKFEIKELINFLIRILNIL